MMTRPAPTVDALAAGVLAGDRTALAQAITRVESTRADHRAQAAELLTRVAPHTGGAHRVGITGVPGVGKSTFIEHLGVMLCEQGHQVAVLAVDPSSTRTGGSILGDKTRMTRLANHPKAYVRPSPTSGTLGGVASHTREALLLCEAAGFDVILVETVGVGQSELAVADMTDSFLVLMLASAGDGLQGIKRGLMELADVLAIQKADLDPAGAERAANTYRNALHLLRPRDAAWGPQVLTCSALTGGGVADTWAALGAHRAALTEAGVWQQRRLAQQRRWMWQLVDEGLRRQFHADARVSAALGEIQAAVDAGTLAPTRAAERLLAVFWGD